MEGEKELQIEQEMGRRLLKVQLISPRSTNTDQNSECTRQLSLDSFYDSIKAKCLYQERCQVQCASQEKPPIS